MAKIIFISYRHNDSGTITNIMHDIFTEVYPPDNVLQDRTTFQVGIDFPEQITMMATTCEVALVVIGPLWMGKDDLTGERRIDKPEDFVRKEVELVLGRNIPVIPVLIQGMKMPKEEDLPPSIRGLTTKQAFELPPIGFKEAVSELIAQIDKLSKTDRELELERPERERREREQQERAAREAFEQQERAAREVFERAKEERLRQEQIRLEQIRLDVDELERPERERRLREAMEQQGREEARLEQERKWKEEERQRDFDQQKKVRALQAQKEEEERLKLEAEAETARKKAEEEARVKKLQNPVTTVTTILAALIGIGLGYQVGGIFLAIVLGLVGAFLGGITGTFLSEGIVEGSGWTIGLSSGIVPSTIVGGYWGSGLWSSHGAFFAVIGTIVGMIAGVIAGPLILGILGSIIAAIAKRVGNGKVKTA